jgi:pimeloyl-ACP methyl ester carboxylesterase
VPEATLADQRRRLERERCQHEADEAGWRYGVPLAFMRQVVAYWRDAFDWRAQETAINQHASYRTTIDGLDIHFIHVRGNGPNPLPLIITHGWPSSFYEMLALIPFLTDPARFGVAESDAFDVVIPSIPGYGFSDRSTRPGFTYRDIADIWVELMERLGYPRFAAHSYDVGGSIMGMLLRRHPERVIGYHTTEPGNPAPYLGPGSRPPSAVEEAYFACQRAWRTEEAGYAAVQTSRPQTLGYGLNDSPVGLAAWILEKWQSWTDPPSGDLLQQFSLDQLLANVTIYWVTETINSANRLYYERAHHPAPVGPDEAITVPLGVALTNQRIERAPREYVERLFRDIRQWRELERGGHFVALEEPELLAQSLRDFFRPLRRVG